MAPRTCSRPPSSSPPSRPSAAVLASGRPGVVARLAPLAWSLALALALSVGATGSSGRYRAAGCLRRSRSLLGRRGPGRACLGDRDRQLAPPSADRADVLEQLDRRTSSSSATGGKRRRPNVRDRGEGGCVLTRRRPAASVGGRTSAAAFLFQGFAVTARVRRRRSWSVSSFSLWRPTGIPRVRVSSGVATGTAGSAPGARSRSGRPARGPERSRSRSRSPAPPHVGEIRFGRAYRSTPGGLDRSDPVRRPETLDTVFAGSSGACCSPTASSASARPPRSSPRHGLT